MNSDKQTIENIKAFMVRVQLQGSETPAFVACMQYLERLEQPARQAPLDKGQKPK